MHHQSSAVVQVEFKATAEGGRRAPVWLNTAQYRPHLRVRGGECLGVVFVSGPVGPVEPGSAAEASVAFVYEPGVNYSGLSEGAQFEIVEGSNVVGWGRVVRRHNS
jgi:translation elongation factor EF-Tu-like GTPase